MNVLFFLTFLSSKILTQWWSNATSQAFVERSQCFVEQYRNFTVKGPGNKDYNVEGRATLRANIADNGSTKMAFQSWKKHFSSDPNGKKYVLLFLVFFGIRNFDTGTRQVNVLTLAGVFFYAPFWSYS